MHRILKLVGLSVIIFIFGFSALIWWGSDREDYFIAKTITKYPGTAQWSINASSGGLDGSPNASIRFQTADKGNKVMDFYSKLLSSQGWQLYWSNVNPIPTRDNIKNYQLKFRKKILWQNYTLIIVKTENDGLSFEGYKDVDIRVNHTGSDWTPN